MGYWRLEEETSPRVRRRRSTLPLALPVRLFSSPRPRFPVWCLSTADSTGPENELVLLAVLFLSTRPFGLSLPSKHSSAQDHGKETCRTPDLKVERERLRRAQCQPGGKEKDAALVRRDLEMVVSRIRRLT